MTFFVRAGELAGVIALWFIALRVWNVGAASPAQAARGLYKGLTPTRVILGLSRLLGGSALAVLALLVLFSVIAPVTLSDLSALAITTLITALAADYLLGSS